MANIEKLYFAPHLRTPLQPYLPDPQGPQPENRPFVTLTYACSLDSKIAAARGIQTVLSGPVSKSMTHYLRIKHDAILVGSGTAITDNPSLNSRLSDALDATGTALQPRPIVLDRRQRWSDYPSSKVVALAKDGRGKKPWVFINPSASDTNPSDAGQLLPEVDRDGAIILTHHGSLTDVLQIMHKKGIKSVMIEGGAEIINLLLAHHAGLIDSLIVTYAPVYLGEGGVTVCPEKPPQAGHVARFEKITWLQLEDDVVMCGKRKS